VSYLILLNILQSSGKEWFEGFHVLQEVFTQYYSKTTPVTVNTWITTHLSSASSHVTFVFSRIQVMAALSLSIIQVPATSIAAE